MRAVQEQRLRQLEREWRVRESKRVAAARAQARALSEATQQLQHGLMQLALQDEMLGASAEQLALKGAALERQAEVEKAEHVREVALRQQAAEAVSRTLASHPTRRARSPAQCMRPLRCF